MKDTTVLIKLSREDYEEYLKLLQKFKVDQEEAR